MTSGILNWRTCKFCGVKYDIGTNFDICPKCRRKKRDGRKKNKPFK